MTVQLSGNGTVLLTGHCPGDDAEELLQHLLAAPNGTVDWSECETAHTAVIQILMAARPKLLGRPVGTELAQWIYPLLQRATS